MREGRCQNQVEPILMEASTENKEHHLSKYEKVNMISRLHLHNKVYDALVNM